jgi:hypothetical protein
MKAIAVVIPSLFTTTVTDTCMLVAPRSQAVIDVVCIGIDASTRSDGGLDQWLDRDLLNVFQHPHHDISTTLDHPEDRWLLRCERAPSALALEPSAPSASPFFATSSGFPLCPATIETSSHAPSPLQVAVDCWATMPWRNWQVTGRSSDAHQTS